MDFMQTLLKRRSIYDIKKEIGITDSELTEMIRSCVKNTPSSYNGQSQRAILLLGENHDKLWNITMEALRKIVPAENFTRTEKKVNGFLAGYGTVMFFDDTEVTNGLLEKFPLYKNNTNSWAIQQNGMLQVNVWNALASKNIGASLQHYNELIEDQIKEVFDIPKTWKLIAEMPFGNSDWVTKPKVFVDIDERFKVIK